jgi:hypothetical protein
MGALDSKQASGHPVGADMSTPGHSWPAIAHEEAALRPASYRNAVHGGSGMSNHLAKLLAARMPWRLDRTRVRDALKMAAGAC